VRQRRLLLRTCKLTAAQRLGLRSEPAAAVYWRLPFVPLGDPRLRSSHTSIPNIVSTVIMISKVSMVATPF
jgi:hypothetical protein